MTDLAQLITEGPLVYAIVAGLVMLDAIFPLAPSETLLASGGVLVATGDVSLVSLVVAGAVGALAGHLLLYVIGRSAGPRLTRRIVRGPKGEKLIEGATRRIEGRPWVLIVADFVPWGRTIFMFSAGALRLGVNRFLAFATIGAVIWAFFYATLGFVGGSVFESTWYSLAASLGVALILTLVLELAGRRRTRSETDASRPQGHITDDRPLGIAEVSAATSSTPRTPGSMISTRPKDVLMPLKMGSDQVC